jgi:hypothetical protein
MPIWLFGMPSRRGRETWERRIASSSSIDDPETVLRKARAALMAILHEHMLPVWTERLPEAAGPDREFLAEERDGSRVVNLILVARYLWFVSRLVASAHQREIHRDLAHRTYRLLSGRLHDASTAVSSGKPTLPRGLRTNPTSTFMDKRSRSTRSRNTASL